MNHERQLYGVCSLTGKPQRAQIVLAGEIPSQADFDSQYRVSILLDGLDGEPWIHVSQVEQLAERIV